MYTYIRMYAVAIFAQVRSLRYREPLFVFARASVWLSMAGRWDEETRQYTPGEQEVQERMRAWGIPAGRQGIVFRWIKMLAESTWFATAVYFPCMWQGVAGLCLCLSSNASTRMSKENGDIQNQRNMGGIQYPEWLLFDVFFYPGLVFGNIDGFSNPRAQRIGTLEHVFDRLCNDTLRMAAWRQHVFVPDRGWVYAGMRTLMNILGIPVHAEVVSGLSYRRMASLDVFVAIQSNNMGVEPPGMALWNAQDDGQRGINFLPRQDQWWYMPVWRPVGQVDSRFYMDYQVELSMPLAAQEVLAVMERNARTADEASWRRMSATLRHLLPAGVAPPGPQMAVLRQLRPVRDPPMLEDDPDREASL